MTTMSISNNKSPLSNNKPDESITQLIKLAGILTLVVIIFAAVLGLLWYTQTATGTSFVQSLTTLFATDTVQAWWYITRASGLTAYLLLWFSMIWGLAIPTKILHPAVEGTYSYDFHEFISLLGLGFVLLHVVVLLFDQFLPFSVWQIAIPFINSYRPFWVGLGIIGFYISLLVTVTFYMRKIIGTKAFRSIHVLSLVGYLGVTLHGLFAGTDSALPLAKILYLGTFLVVIFMMVYWLVLLGIAKQERTRQATVAKRKSSAQRFNPIRR